MPASGNRSAASGTCAASSSGRTPPTPPGENARRDWVEAARVRLAYSVSDGSPALRRNPRRGGCQDRLAGSTPTSSCRIIFIWWSRRLGRIWSLEWNRFWAPSPALKNFAWSSWPAYWLAPSVRGSLAGSSYYQERFEAQCRDSSAMLPGPQNMRRQTMLSHLQEVGRLPLDYMLFAVYPGSLMEGK